MAVANTNTSVTYQGNGSTVTPYPIPFAYLTALHLEVRVKATGGVWVKIAPVQWAIVSGGLRITSGAVPTTSQVKITRSTPNLQPNQYVVGGKFPASAHETALDRLTMLVQERTPPYFNQGNRPVVVGARNNNDALASLLAQLSGIGLITNSTSAGSSSPVGEGMSLMEGPANSGKILVVKNGLQVGYLQIFT
jgi:hypothetical protein